MNPFCRFLLMVIWTLGLTHVSAADTIYFLVAELPDRKNHNDSYVLPLSKQEDIDHARYLISRWRSGYLNADRAIVVAEVGAAEDDINRNYLDPRFPKWSWQVSQFLEFADITAEILDGSPAQLEPFDGSSGGQTEIGFWAYTVVRELGPNPLYLSMVPQGQNLQFYWSGTGTNYVYTLESNKAPTATNWIPVPGASWPLKTNQWTLARTNSPPRFYRVKAEQILQ